MGGVPFCMLAIYQTGFHSLLLPDSSGAPQGQKGIELGQKVAKVNFSLGCLVFSRYFWRQQTAKSKHIFGKWCECVVSCAPLVEVFHRVHWVQVVRSCSLSLGVFRPFCPCLCPFPALLAVSLANMALFRVLRAFLARFGVFVGVCVAWVLCAACVAFVRVWS